MVDDDVTVMEDVIMKKEILQEICRNEAGKEQEDEEEGYNENEIAEGKTQQQIDQAIETFINLPDLQKVEKQEHLP